METASHIYRGNHTWRASHIERATPERFSEASTIEETVSKERAIGSKQTTKCKRAELHEETKVERASQVS